MSQPCFLFFFRRSFGTWNPRVFVWTWFSGECKQSNSHSRKNVQSRVAWFGQFCRQKCTTTPWKPCRSTWWRRDLQTAQSSMEKSHWWNTTLALHTQWRQQCAIRINHIGYKHTNIIPPHFSDSCDPWKLNRDISLIFFQDGLSYMGTLSWDSTSGSVAYTPEIRAGDGSGVEVLLQSYGEWSSDGVWEIMENQLPCQGKSMGL